MDYKEGLVNLADNLYVFRVYRTYKQMSQFSVPSQSIGNYNKAFFKAETDLDYKADKVNGVLTSPTLVNPTFSGTVTGLAEFNDTREIYEANSFPDDVTAYYDFSIPDNLGYDFSGRKRHATNMNGVKYLSDGTRTHTASFAPNQDILNVSGVPVYTLASKASETHRILNISEHISAIATPSFTFAAWIKPSGLTASTIFNMGSGTALTDHCTRFEIYTYNNTITVTADTFTNSVKTVYFLLSRPIVTNVWTHVTFTLSPTGTKLYFNGVLMSATYTSSNSSSYVNLSTLNLVHCQVGTSATQKVGILGMYSSPFIGQMSDVIMFSRAITVDEVLVLYGDNYGSDIIPLAGQSNMVGSAVRETQDQDYTLISPKVLQWSPQDNMNLISDPPLIIDNILSAAENPLRHVNTNADSMGLWYTFIQEYLKNTTIAYRRKIVLVAVAQGATGFNNNIGQGWRTTGICYKRAELGIRSAVTMNFLNRVTMFLWNQGEHDIVNFNPQYQLDFQNMMNGFASTVPTFDYTKIPVILGEISQGGYDEFVNGVNNIQNKVVIREAMQSLVVSNPTFALVKTSDLKVKPTDNAHWDAPSIRTMGRRYYDEIARLTGNLVRTQSEWTSTDSTGQPVKNVPTLNVMGNAMAKNITCTGLTVSGMTLSGGNLTVSGLLTVSGINILSSICGLQSSVNANSALITGLESTVLTGSLTVVDNSTLNRQFAKITVMSTSTTYNPSTLPSIISCNAGSILTITLPTAVDIGSGFLCTIMNISTTHELNINTTSNCRYNSIPFPNPLGAAVATTSLVLQPGQTIRLIANPTIWSVL